MPDVIFTDDVPATLSSQSPVPRPPQRAKLDINGDDYWDKREKYPARLAAKLHALTTEGRRILVPSWLRRIVSGDTQLLVFAQLYYWFSKKALGEIKGELGSDQQVVVIKTYAELGAEIDRSPDAVRVAVKRLIKVGLIQTEQHRSPYHGGQKTTHFYLNVKKIIEAVEASGDFTKHSGSKNI
jgi:hypothetical protein